MWRWFTSGLGGSLRFGSVNDLCLRHQGVHHGPGSMSPGREREREHCRMEHHLQEANSKTFPGIFRVGGLQHRFMLQVKLSKVQLSCFSLSEASIKLNSINFCYVRVGSRRVGSGRALVFSCHQGGCCGPGRICGVGLRQSTVVGAPPTASQLQNLPWSSL